MLALGVLVIGGVVAAMLEGAKLDAESKAFAQASVNAIVPTWSEDELRSRASPEFYAATSPAQLEDLFGELREKLGLGVTADACRGQSYTTFWWDRGTTDVSAVYYCRLHTIPGTGYAKLTVKDYGGAWKIVGLHVYAPAPGTL